MLRKRFTYIGIEFLLVSLGQVIAILVSFIGVRFMTNYLSPQSYGEISLFLTFTTLSQQLIVGPLANAILRYYPVAKEREQIPEFFKSINSLICISVLMIFFLGLMVFLFVLSSDNQHHIITLLATIAYTIFFSLNTYFEQIQSAARKRLVVAWHQGFGQVMRYTLAVGVMIIFGSSSKSVLVGFLTAAFFTLLSQLFFLRKQIDHQWMFTNFSFHMVRIDIWGKRVLIYSLPFIIWGLFTWGQQASDRWALNEFQSTQFVGFYTVLYQIGYFPMIILNQVVVQFISPILFQKAGDGTDAIRTRTTTKITEQLVLLSACLTLFLTAICYVISGKVLNLLAAPEYFIVHSYLPLLVLSGGIFSSAQIFAMIPLYKNKPQTLLNVKIVTAILGIVLNFIGAIVIGLLGVILGGLVFSISYLFGVFYASRKHEDSYE